MKYKAKRVHEIGDPIQGYRVIIATCKCGWSGPGAESLDEYLQSYRSHVLGDTE